MHVYTLGKMAVVYDLCIVGAGMVGSAAARHATTEGRAHQTTRVCLIGPPEPKTKSMTSSRTIFGCHYDEGRLTTEIHVENVAWSILTSHSMKRYRDIENKSGVRFFSESGYILSGISQEKTFRDYLENVRKISNTLPIGCLSGSETRKLFPYFNFGKNDISYYQKINAGHISARNMVLAQQTIAKEQGCDVIHDVVTQVTERNHSDRTMMEVKTESGVTLLARKVLLATNAFTNKNDLLPKGISLDIRPYPTCAVFCELTEETARRFGGMPSVNYEGFGADDWREVKNLDITNGYSIYVLPPIRYPDGKFYMKLGCLHKLTPPLDTLQDMKAWYCNPPPQGLVDDLASVLSSMVKGVEPVSIKGDTCITAYTATGLPYIDKISECLTVAVGCCGVGAMSSDEIGRLGMDLALNDQWNSKLSPELFRVQTTNIA